MSNRRAERDPNQHEYCDARQSKIAERPSHRRQDVITYRITEVAWIDRSRFCPSENNASSEKSNEREDNRSQHIDVRQRIQRNSTKPACRRIATAVCHPRVGGLMHANRKEKRDVLKNLIDDFRALEIHLLVGASRGSSILADSPRSPAAHSLVF